MVDVTPRDGTVADASLLARLDVQSWRETYDGLLSSPRWLDSTPIPFTPAVIGSDC